MTVLLKWLNLPGAGTVASLDLEMLPSIVHWPALREVQSTELSTILTPNSSFWRIPEERQRTLDFDVLTTMNRYDIRYGCTGTSVHSQIKTENSHISGNAALWL